LIIVTIQLGLALAGTILFLLFGSYPQNALGSLAVLGMALVFFVASIILMLLILLVYIFAAEKVNPKSVAKHKFYNQYGFYLFNYLLRVIVKVTGKENLPKTNRFIVVSNHIEYSDPVYIKQAFYAYPMAFVAKEELFRYLVVRNLMQGAGCISINRSNTRAGLQSILDTVNAIKGGQPMAIFPEGTRSYQNAMIPFKPGSFKLALKAEADIIPVCLYDMHGIFGGFRIGIHKCRLHILPTIPFADIAGKDTTEISNLVQARIEAKMQVFRETAGKDK